MNLNQSLHNKNQIRPLHPLLTAILILTLTWLAILCWTSVAWAESGVIKGKVVNIRSGPGTNYQPVGSVYQGTQVTISERQGDWYKITIGNTTGWVAASLISPQVSGKVIVTGNTVNLRSEPKMGDNIVGQVSQGDTLTLLGTEGEWYKVKTSDGRTCYIAASLARKVDTASTSSQATTDTKPASGKKIKALYDDVNLRSEPSVNSKSLGFVPFGEVFTVLNVQGEWYQISLKDGVKGWVAAKMVEEVKSAGTTPTTPTTPTPSASGTGTKTPVVILDGQRLNFEVDPIIENDRTLVPLRAIFEAMGAHVQWDAATNTVTAVRDGIKVILTIGSTQPTVDGKVWPLDVPAKIIKDRTLAPLRFVGEAFGGKVEWDQSTYTVTMTSPASKGTPAAVIVDKDKVHLRSGPNSSFESIALIEPGEKLTVVGERDGWYEVSRGSTRGWVASWVVDVAWEANEPIPDPNLPPAEETPETTPAKPDRPGEDVIWLSCEKDEIGYTIGIESGSIIDAKIKERSSEVVYTIKDRKVEGQYYFEESFGSSKLTMRGTQDGDDVQVKITFPSGTEYRTATDMGGKKELLIIPNFIQEVKRKAFSSNGERLIITTALPAQHSAQQKGDRLEVTLEGIVMGKARDEYTFKDSELIDSVSFVTKGESTLITINTTDLGKYSLGLGGSQGNELNIMMVNKSAIKARQENLVVIDPGHGGNDTGARGTKVDEKELNLQVALMVGEILKKNGVDVEYTRDGDSTVGLETRAEIANALNAGLFVSIHHNSTTTSDKAGTETYYYAPPERPDLFMQKDERQKLATEIHKRLISNLRRTDRGVKQANFSVLRNTQMPSVLCEICFISNPEEQNLAMKNTFQELAARAIADGILAYMGK
jgi:N-acetylmuramoyl-L-alanine amidase